MSIPTHGPDCHWVHNYPTTCKHCKVEVIYLECNHGAKVFLELPDRGRHNCEAYVAESLGFTVKEWRKFVDSIDL